MKKDYAAVVYEERRAPRSTYPQQLITYLIDRFGLRTGDHLLEISCGRGDFIESFQKAGLRCSGVDREKSSVDVTSDVDIIKCDVSKDELPFDNKTFDVVFHKSLIEHFFDPTHCMDETQRVLKEGGKLIILTPDWESQMQTFYEDFTHYRPYTTLAIRDLLHMWGFKNIIAEKFYQLPFLWEYPYMSFFSKMLSVFFSVNTARWLTGKTRIKFFRWSVELMILGYGEK